MRVEISLVKSWSGSGRWSHAHRLGTVTLLNTCSTLSSAFSCAHLHDLENTCALAQGASANRSRFEPCQIGIEEAHSTMRLQTRRSTKRSRKRTYPSSHANRTQHHALNMNRRDQRGAIWIMVLFVTMREGCKTKIVKINNRRKHTGDEVDTATRPQTKSCTGRKWRRLEQQMKHFQRKDMKRKVPCTWVIQRARSTPGKNMVDIGTNSRPYCTTTEWTP